MIDPNRPNPDVTPEDSDDDAARWNQLAQLLGANPKSEAWDQPRPAAAPADDRGRGKSTHPPRPARAELDEERAEQGMNANWDALAGNLGLSAPPSATEPAASVAPSRSPSSPPPTAATPTTPPTSSTSGYGGGSRGGDSRGRSDDRRDRERELDRSQTPPARPAPPPRVPPTPMPPPQFPANLFAEDDDDDFGSGKPGAVLKDLFGPANSRLANDPDLDPSKITRRDFDDTVPIDEVRFEAYGDSFGDFGDEPSGSGDARSATIRPEGDRAQGDRPEQGSGSRRGSRGRRRGRGRGRDRERGGEGAGRQVARDDEGLEDSDVDRQRRPAPQRPSQSTGGGGRGRSGTSDGGRGRRGESSYSKPRPAPRVDDEFDDLDADTFGDDDKEPTTWNGASPAEELITLDPLEPDDLDDVHDENEGDDREERGRRMKHPKLPSWEDTIGFIVNRNLAQRTQNQGSGGGGGGSRRRRGGPPRRRPQN